MTALYVYAIVAGSFDPAGAPGGIDERPVELYRAGGLGALTSPIDERQYAPEVVAKSSQDLDWLGARAAAHDRVITWAIDRGTVIPLPLFSLFRDTGRVHRILLDREPELRRTLDDLGAAREYTVRVFRLDSELAATMASRSPEVAQLEARAAEAPPGQRYLLDRKLGEMRRNEIERVGRETADQVCESLAGIARETVREDVVATAGAAGQAVLNASFLVGARDLEAFRAAMTDVMSKHGAHGFRFEFAGPLAPYHFVQTLHDTPPGAWPAPTPPGESS